MTIQPPDRVLVTGAAGFLGRHVVSELSVLGYRIIATTSSRQLPEELVRRCAKVMRGDVSDDSFLARAVRDIDGICHAAAYVPASHEDVGEAERCLQVNALATLKLGQLALEREVRRFVYMGAGNAYSASLTAVSEDSAQYPSGHGSYYLTSKMVGEIYLDHLRRERGLPAVSLRAPNIYGPGMREDCVVQRFVRQAVHGHPLDVHHGGLPSADHVYAGDVAWCIAAALGKGLPAAYNVGTGQSWSLLELAEMVAAIYQAQAGIQVRPVGARRPDDFPPLCISKASTTWGYRPLSLRDGLERLRQATAAASGSREP